MNTDLDLTAKDSPHCKFGTNSYGKPTKNLNKYIKPNRKFMQKSEF